MTPRASPLAALAAVILFTAAACSALPRAALDSTAEESIIDIARAHLAVRNANPEAVMFAAQALDALNAGGAAKESSAICKVAKSAAGSKSAFEAAQGTIAASLAGCKGVVFPESVISELLDEGVESLALLINAYAAAGKKDAVVDKAAKALLGFLNSDGSFKGAASKASSTGTAVAAVAQAKALGKGQDAAKKVVAKANSIVSVIVKEGASKVDPAAAGASLFGLLSLNAQLSGSQINALAALASEGLVVPGLRSSALVAAGLRSAAQTLSKPFVVKVLTPRVSASARDNDAKLRVSVKDTLGRAADGVKVVMKSATADDDREVVSNVPLQSEGEGIHSLTLVGRGLPASRIQAELQVGPTLVKVPFIVSAPLTVPELEINVVSEQHPTKSYRLKGDKTLPATLALHPGTSISVRGSPRLGRTGAPLSLTAAVTLQEQGSDLSFTAGTAAASNGKNFEVVVKNDDGMQEELRRHGGKYSLRLVLTDAAAEAAVVRKLGDVQVECVGEEIADPSARFGMLPAIEHQFRAPDRRPPVFIALLACGAIGAAFFGLITLLGRMGALKITNGWSLSALVMHGSLIAIAALYVLFFLRLNMFNTLTAMVFVVPVWIVSSKSALSAVKAARKAASSQASEVST